MFFFHTDLLNQECNSDRDMDSDCKAWINHLCLSVREQPNSKQVRSWGGPLRRPCLHGQGQSHRDWQHHAELGAGKGVHHQHQTMQRNKAGPKSVLHKEKGISRSKRRQDFCPDGLQVYSETRTASLHNSNISQASTKGPQLTLNGASGLTKGRRKLQVRLDRAVKVLGTMTLRPFCL